MDGHKEHHFEAEIVADLVAAGWLEGSDRDYDKATALYTEDVLWWLNATQQQAIVKYQRKQPGDPRRRLVTRLIECLNQSGSLEILRRGFVDIGSRFQMCQFRPATTLNPQTWDDYRKVRCRVVRQVHYSESSQNSIDLVFFVNGIPVATAELKTDFTQDVDSAIQQYRNDRLPKGEILLDGRRALVHFAVSNDQVWMTTKLAGAKTRFLPFNQGNNGGAGNPLNSNGHRTAYWWQQILQRDTWLHILGSFIHEQTTETIDSQGRIKREKQLIFPRYHQLMAVSKVVAAAQTEGSGQRYLIQHSAGSGKSNSIAWLAHQLARVHNAANKNIFDSVIVITDRTVLDRQLEATIRQFDHQDGVVKHIDSSVKSQQLTEALLAGTKIIITTVQTFPFVLEKINHHGGALRDKRFAIIADEAHSSQSGSTANRMTQVLTSDSTNDEPINSEDWLLELMEQRAEHPNLSYIAFTATPKSKTLMRFGRPPEPGAEPAPFHVYTMQQAIEEGYILDVLQNYTTYSMAFELAQRVQNQPEQIVDSQQATTELLRWVKLHDQTIASKVEIIIEHFRANVATLLAGKAKAMVVTDSRLAAVRYFHAMQQYVRQQPYSLGVLVAFSGEINDPHTAPEAQTERSLNAQLAGRDIAQALASDDYQLLIVANKYQTGFDQPLLSAMYIDKRLAGVNTVQTLSRLNRTYPGKKRTFILDFVNQPDEIIEAFQPYYRVSELAQSTDPNLVHTLQNQLDREHIYTDDNINSFVEALITGAAQSHLRAQINPAVERFNDRWKRAEQRNDGEEQAALQLFRKNMQSYLRTYDFLSQIINYASTELEKRAMYYRGLLPNLQINQPNASIDLSQIELTQYHISNNGENQLHLSEEQAPLYSPNALGSATPRDREQASLAEILSRLNSLFAGKSEADIMGLVNPIKTRMLAHPQLAQQAKANSRDQFAHGSFPSILTDAIVEGMQSHNALAEQLLANQDTFQHFMSIMLDLVYSGFQQQQA